MKATLAPGKVIDPIIRCNIGTVFAVGGVSVR